MKGLDTPVLLAILRGAPAAKKLVRTLAGEEIGTTEWNLYELEVLARKLPAGGRDRRLAVLEKLRRRIAVLPLDRRAVQATLPRNNRATVDSHAPILSLMLGAMEANGATEWFTSAEYAGVRSPGRCKVRVFTGKSAESR